MRERRSRPCAGNELLLALGFTQEGRLRQRWVAKEETYDRNIYGLRVEDWLDRTVTGVRQK